MVHGLQDITVDPAASAAIFALARGPKAAVWLRGTDHHMRSRFDEVVAILVGWVTSLLRERSDPGAGADADADAGVLLELDGLGLARTL